MITTPLQILTFFFLTLLSHGISQTTEQSILLGLQRQWSNPSLLSHWTPSSDHCKWPEVTCTDGAITKLEIVQKNITAPIPASICDLKNLTYINLALNFIRSSFPTVLYNCSRLEYLNLSQNYFVGTIPDNVSQLSPRLQLLSLDANNFTGDIPAGIGSFPELVTLRLSDNLFHGSFPAELGNLSNLEELVLSNNQFKPQSLPASFGKLTKLRNLWIPVANLIGKIPEEFGNMSALEFLDLSDNRLTGSIPSSLFLLRNMTILYLYKNSLSGSIPRKVELLSLQVIDLSNNSLTGTIPDDFGKLANMTGLALFFNQLSGEVPPSLGTLPKLIDFNIFSNNLSGVLPPDLGRYSNLTRLQFSENQFSGELPKYLCANNVLIGVIAFKNNLTGGLDSLGNCSSLQIVRAHDNMLSGKVPKGLWTSKNLETLMLSNNFLVGELPERIGLQLSRLELTNNKISGRIPFEISSWQKLTVFEISNNLLNGDIPQEFTALSSLSTALLDGNSLSGHLPSNIISWKSLTILNLSKNQLSGEIPASFSRLQNLMDLDLSGNKLSGPIPTGLGKSLTSLNLSSNQLAGRIPAQFENAAFDRSFLNNSELCSNVPSLGINACRSGTGKSDKLSSKFIAAVSSIAAVAFLVGVSYTIFFCRRYKNQKEDRDSTWKLTSFQRLNFTEGNILSSLTDENLIGSGGSGRVYRVPIHHMGEHVAVKRIWDNVKLGHKLEKEFQAEVQILGTIRHSNIVKLYCCISSEASKLLVYEYMENRSLDRWLHKKRFAPYTNSGLGSVHHTVILDWPKRLQIAVGAAQGLCYMHHQCSQPIIHRDLKSSNILLDSQFNPKIADFGLARMLVNNREANTMSVVAGSFGYMAPEYCQTRRVSEKVDVYSFGVILLELITGREAQNGDETSSLVDWAWRCVQEGKPMYDALDEDIREPIYLDEIYVVFKLGLSCTSKFPSSRPSMRGALQVLLQCSGREDRKNSEWDAAPLLQNSKSKRLLDSDDDVFTSV